MTRAWWSKWLERAGAVVPFAFPLYILLHSCVTGFSAVVPFRGDPIDGAFQIFDPLRRIAAGQIAGVDFQFYHGILLPFIHYPLFALLGKTIFASEISRHIVSMCAFLISLYVLFFAYVRKPRTSATLATVALLLMIVAGAYALIYPEVSLTGLRGTAPLVFFAILLSNFEAIRIATALGLVAALAMVTSTEHGLAVTMAFMVAAVIFALRHGEFSRCWRPALVFVISLASGLVIVIGGLSHFRGIWSILKYNFVEVPTDQYWLFGSPPASAPASLGDLFADPRFAVPFLVTSLIFIASLIVALWRPAKSMAELPQAGVVMSLYALLTFTSFLARHSPEYSFSAIRICCIYLVLLAARFGPQVAARFRSKMPAPAAFAHIAVAVFAVGFVVLRPNYLAITGLRAQVQALNANHWQPALDMNWQTYLNTADALMPDAAGKTIWATYSGLLQDHFGKFNPSTDYIIHVLGPQRRDQYLRRLQEVRPDYVETLPTGGAFIWEEWLHNTFWDCFYRELLLNYTRKGVTNHSVIWERKSPGMATFTPAKIVAEGHLKGPVSIPLPESLGREQLLVVELEYETRNPWRWLPVIGRAPRFVVHWDGVRGPSITPSMALPDYRSGVGFSLLPHLGQNPQLRFSVESVLPGAEIDVRRVSLSVLSLDPVNFYEYIGARAEDALPGELRAFSFTDTNWMNGVWINHAARNQAGFFVLATKAHDKTLAHARAVVFNGSGRRAIQAVERNGPYVNIFVDGPPLSPYTDGFPNLIRAE